MIREVADVVGQHPARMLRTVAGLRRAQAVAMRTECRHDRIHATVPEVFFQLLGQWGNLR